MKKDEELFRLFKEETRKYLKSGRSALERVHEDSKDGKNIKVLYRTFHEIKGMAGMFDAKMIYELSRCAEIALVPSVKDGKALSKELNEIISGSLDILGRLAESMENGKTEKKTDLTREYNMLIKQLKGLC